MHHRSIGGWTVRSHSLVYRVERNYSYTVDLDRCTTAAEVLDWICQIAGKTWADDACLAGLVRALNSTLRPQATLIHAKPSRSD